jgi:hypothetical protein
VKRLVPLLAVLALAGCGGAGSPEAQAPATGPATTPAAPAPTTTAAGTTTVRIYLLRNEKVAPVARRIPATEGVGRAAVEQLLAGPRAADGGLATAVPDATRLLGLSVRDGVATVDLSGEFASGGGSLSMQARLAQLVYTLTQFPTATRVRLELDGKAITTLGGEGIAVDHPLARDEFEDLTPQILVETPLPNATVTSPLRLSGTANTFEAQFEVEARAGDGRLLAKDYVTATSGSGERGTYDFSLPVEAPPGPIRLIVFELSAEDGTTHLHEVEIPLRLQRG